MNVLLFLLSRACLCTSHVLIAGPTCCSWWKSRAGQVTTSYGGCIQDLSRTSQDKTQVLHFSIRSLTNCFRLDKIAQKPQLLCAFHHNIKFPGKFHLVLTIFHLFDVLSIKFLYDFRLVVASLCKERRCS